MAGLDLCRTGRAAGLLTVVGGFLVQLAVGSFYGTFGNLVPYLSAYLRWVLKIISVGIPTYAGMKTGLYADFRPRNRKKMQKNRFLNNL